MNKTQTPSIFLRFLGPKIAPWILWAFWAFVLVCFTSMGVAQTKFNKTDPNPPPKAAPAAETTKTSAPTAPSPASAVTAIKPQESASDTVAQSLLDRKTQKVEHLRLEDRGNRIDEIRAGGETKSITVQPKNGMPAYQVQPTNSNNSRPDAGIGQTGVRMWTIHQF